MPGAGPLSRGDFRKLYADRLAYIDSMIGPDEWPEDDPAMWEQFYNIKTSNKMREEVLYWGGFGRFVEMGENDAVTYDQIVQGPSKSITHTLWGLGFQIGYLTQKHDLDGIVAKNAPALGLSMRQSIQAFAMELYNNLGTETTADGVAVVATTHTFVRGSGTFSNRTTSNIGQAALEAGLVAFRRQKDLMGNPQPLPAESLLIPPDLEPISHELLQSRMRSDTTTHAESFVYNKVTPKASPWIDSTTQWLIMGPRKQLKIVFYWNIRPETSHGYDFDREAVKTKALWAGSRTAIDPRGIYGFIG